MAPPRRPRGRHAVLKEMMLPSSTSTEAKLVQNNSSDDCEMLDKPHKERASADGDYQEKRSKPTNGKTKKQPRTESGKTDVVGKSGKMLNEDFLSTIPRTNLTTEELWKAVTKLEHENASLKRQLAQEKKGRNEESEKRARSVKRSESRLHQANVLRGKEKSQADQLKDAHLEIANLEQKLSDQEKAIRGLQDERLAEYDHADIVADADVKITTQLNTLFSWTKDWAKKWARPDWTSVPTEEVDAILSATKESVLPEVASVSGRRAIKLGVLAPRVVVNSLLNRTLISLTLSTPFRILAGDNTLSNNATTADLFENVHTQVMQSKSCFTSETVF